MRITALTLTIITSLFTIVKTNLISSIDTLKCGYCLIALSLVWYIIVFLKRTFQSENDFKISHINSFIIFTLGALSSIYLYFLWENPDLYLFGSTNSIIWKKLYEVPFTAMVTISLISLLATVETKSENRRRLEQEREHSKVSAFYID